MKRHNVSKVFEIRGNHIILIPNRKRKERIMSYNHKDIHTLKEIENSYADHENLVVIL